MKNIFGKANRILISVYITSLILLLGFVLQLLIGNIDFRLLSSPISYIILLAVIVICLYYGINYRNSRFARFASSVSFSVTLMVSLLALTLIMGLTTQRDVISVFSSNSDNSLVDILGFSSMTISWPFVLIYLSLLISLGILTVRRFSNFKISHYSFYLNHLGLWILLASAGMGTADLERYIIRLTPGSTENIAIDSRARLKDLSFNIQLNNFTINHYPAQIAVVDIEQGRFIGSSPRDIYHQISGIDDRFCLGEWSFSVIDFQKNGTIDSLLANAHNISKIHSQSSHQSAQLVATRILPSDSTKTYNGILSYNPTTPSSSMILGLDWPQAAIMLKPEVSSYESCLSIISSDGTNIIDSAKIRVNHPIGFGSWKIYQHGYHEDLISSPGSSSKTPSPYISLELVYDPWIIPAYIGIIMLMLGSASMLWSGTKVSRSTSKAPTVKNNI